MRLISPLPVCRGKEEPVACYNKPCHWSFDPTDPETQVLVTDGNCLYTETDKARGRSSGKNQRTSSVDFFLTSIQNPIKTKILMA